MTAYLEDRNPFFGVKKEKVFTESGLELPNKVALVNEDMGSVVGFVSPGYDVVHNEVVRGLCHSHSRLECGPQHGCADGWETCPDTDDAIQSALDDQTRLE